MRRGEIAIVADDEDRENEGDLIMAAEAATAEKIAFLFEHEGKPSPPPPPARARSSAGTMNVAVDLAADPTVVCLEDPNEFRSFKVVVGGPEDVRVLGAAFEPIGRVDPDRTTASRRVDAVKALAGGHPDYAG